MHCTTSTMTLCYGTKWYLVLCSESYSPYEVTKIVYILQFHDETTLTWRSDYSMYLGFHLVSPQADTGDCLSPWLIAALYKLYITFLLGKERCKYEINTTENFRKLPWINIIGFLNHCNFIQAIFETLMILWNAWGN